MRALLLLALLSGCGAPALTIANGVALGVQSAALACDWQQTRRASEAGWPGKMTERNQVIRVMDGSKPASSAVDAYFIGALALSALGWYVIPRRWRIIVPIVITSVQLDAIVHNTKTPLLGVCGITGDHASR